MTTTARKIPRTETRQSIGPLYEQRIPCDRLDHTGFPFDEENLSRDTNNSRPIDQPDRNVNRPRKTQIPPMPYDRNRSRYQSLSSIFSRSSPHKSHQFSNTTIPTASDSEKQWNFDDYQHIQFPAEHTPSFQFSFIGDPPYFAYPTVPLQYMPDFPPQHLTDFTDQPDGNQSYAHDPNQNSVSQSKNVSSEESGFE